MSGSGVYSKHYEGPIEIGCDPKQLRVPIGFTNFTWSIVEDDSDPEKIERNLPRLFYKRRNRGIGLVIIQCTLYAESEGVSYAVQSTESVNLTFIGN